MIAQRRADVADLNARGRDQLLATGRLEGPELELPGGAFAAGDRVVIKRNDLRLGVHNGQGGRVVRVDEPAGALVIAVDDRTVTLDAAFLRGVTQAGDPTLLHGYAITGHVAQGLTVDRSFVLAAAGMSQEWAYVAMSRGRLSNRLYLPERFDDERAEFAPLERHRGDAVARLAASLQRSDCQVLAIDTGRPPPELSRAGLEAGGATWRRERLEARRFNWLPTRRRALKHAREHERVAGDAYAEATRVAAEQAHAARPFVSQQDREAAEAQRSARSVELQTQRVLRRALGRGFGREL
jgi:hypothetical protein